MENRVALVTGGMGGIGESICQALCKEGVRVMTTYFKNGDHAVAQEWQLQQQELGYEIDICYVDIRDYQSCVQLKQDVEDKYGYIDILVNNAGITRDSSFLKMDLEEWNEVIQANLNSLYNITKQFISKMVERKYGRIINISSINGQKGQFGQANYAAAKAGIIGFTKTLAQEVAKKGVTVNSISPGYVATKMVMSVPENIRNAIIEQIPVGRLGKPEEIARCVTFLAAEESGFITGANLSINGGHYMA